MTSRRRQRSTRLSVAAAVLVAAAVFVVGAALAGSFAVLVGAAAVAVLLGAAATRITYSELIVSRRDAARDRAALAVDYRNLTDARVAEQAVFAAAVGDRLRGYEETVDRLGHALVAARTEVAAERQRAGAAENRAADAIVRVAELERELGVVTAEWQAVVATSSALSRKHA